MKFLVVISLLLNLGLGIYAAKFISPNSGEISQTRKKVLVPEKEIEAVPTDFSERAREEISPFAGFNWSLVESPDYKIYVANLRSIGCPERTVRDIIEAELDDWFMKERKQILEPFQRDFWEITKAGTQESFQVFEKKIEKLKEERDKIEKEVLGEPEKEKPDNLRQFKKYADFLSREKMDALASIADKFNKLQKEISKQNPKLPPDESRQKMKELSDLNQAEIKNALSAEEYDEYQLRNSRHAGAGRMAGFDASVEELKTLARINMQLDENLKDIVPATDAETKKKQQQEKDKRRDDEMKQVLGAERFVDFKRSQDNNFSQIYRVAQRMKVPKEVAVQVDDIRKAALANADQVRKNVALPEEKRAEVLQTIQKETQKTLERTFGTEPLKIYKKHGGDWINDLGNIPENQP